MCQPPKAVALWNGRFTSLSSALIRFTVVALHRQMAFPAWRYFIWLDKIVLSPKETFFFQVDKFHALLLLGCDQFFNISCSIGSSCQRPMFWWRAFEPSSRSTHGGAVWPCFGCSIPSSSPCPSRKQGQSLQNRRKEERWKNPSQRNGTWANFQNCEKHRLRHRR